MIAEVPSGRLGFISVPRVLAVASTCQAIGNHLPDLQGERHHVRQIRLHEVPEGSPFPVLPNLRTQCCDQVFHQVLLYAIRLVDISLGLSLHERIRL